MKRILIVEDDGFLNKMLAYNLTADDYEVTSALNAGAAAAALRQRGFDLVLLDLNLPDGNGFELCRRIKPEHPDTIVIFLTANDQESDQIRGYEAGAVDYITKPFVLGALQRKIKAMFAMLERHRPAGDIYDDGRLIDRDAFEQGKIVLLSQTAAGLIRPGQEITVQTQSGPHSFVVANGFLRDDFRAGGGNERGSAPDLYISQAALQALFPQHRIFRVAFDTDGRQDETILRELKRIAAPHADSCVISRYERREKIREYLVTANVLGTGLSAILLLVGVMNFVNTMAVNVSTRRYELAILESVGMTKRQIRRMLSIEGCCYGGVSLALAATVGTVLYAALYRVFSQAAPYAVFCYPFVPLALAAGLVLLICFLVPVWTYKAEARLPVVERLRSPDAG